MWSGCVCRFRWQMTKATTHTHTPFILTIIENKWPLGKIKIAGRDRCLKNRKTIRKQYYKRILNGLTGKVRRQNNKFLYGRGYSEKAREDWRHLEIKTNVRSHQKDASQTAADENNELQWLRSQFLVRSRITVLIGNWLTKLNLPHHSWLSISMSFKVLIWRQRERGSFSS